MPDHPLFLFKTARRPIYKKENLDLLAAERGSVMEFAWNRSWVAPEYFDEGAIPRGTLAYFVFTDRPYECFVPVREGEVVSADWLIAGGLRQPEWEERLEDLTGAKLEWCEAFRDETDDLDAFADRIRNGRYALVVHFLQKTGHQTGDVLRPACEECDVPFVASRSAGRRGVEEAIWEGVAGTA